MGQVHGVAEPVNSLHADVTCRITTNIINAFIHFSGYVSRSDERADQATAMELMSLYLPCCIMFSR